MTESNGVCVAIAGFDYEQRPTSWYVYFRLRTAVYSACDWLSFSGIPTPVNDMIIVRNGKVITDGTLGVVWLYVQCGLWVVGTRDLPRTLAGADQIS